MIIRDVCYQGSIAHVTASSDLSQTSQTIQGYVKFFFPMPFALQLDAT